MGANWCSPTETINHADTNRKIQPKAKHGAENLEPDELLFNEENITTDVIESDLYSEFSENMEDTDNNEDGEETDWDNYANDVTFDRKGVTKNMFKQELIDEALELASDELKKLWLEKGPLQIKQKDVPEEIDPDEIEFKHIQVKNDEGDAYIGEFRKGTTIREGRGILISHENYMYEGFWIDDVKFGFGRMIVFNGNVYQGEWNNDKSEGRGLYCTDNQMIYKGDWKENKCHGTGVELYNDGSKFMGKFKNGEKNGKGFFKWIDGRQYKGYFKGGLMDGLGDLTWPDGRSYSGEWKENK